jgi:uncharacterized membrane protein
MLELIIIVLIVLWLLGAFGSRFSPRIPHGGSLIHVLLVIAIILIALKLLRII